MTKTIFAIALATVATVGAASASTPLVNDAQNLLDEYGFDVDAGTLSTAELAGLHFIDDVEESSDAEVKAKIASVIN